MEAEHRPFILSDMDKHFWIMGIEIVYKGKKDRITGYSNGRYGLVFRIQSTGVRDDHSAIELFKNATFIDGSKFGV
jgi:hypothetical protein